MSHSVPAHCPTEEDVPLWMARLQAAGAESADAVAWHYIRTLAERASTHPGPVQELLRNKLQLALHAMETRLAQKTAAANAADAQGTHDTQALPPASPLALLLQDMGVSTSADQPALYPPGSLAESPRIRLLRQQLRRIGVRKEVSRAMASRPKNAGPINSHMLVLRALGLLRDISPDYLNRFMVHLDTLLCLHDHQARAATPAAKSSRSRKTARS